MKSYKSWYTKDYHERLKQLVKTTANICYICKTTTSRSELHIFSHEKYSGIHAYKKGYHLHQCQFKLNVHIQSIPRYNRYTDHYIIKHRRNHPTNATISEA
ncbi:hypothetical protein ACOSQ4_024164 [Xanthoceras sorbifolium]